MIAVREAVTERIGRRRLGQMVGWRAGNIIRIIRRFIAGRLGGVSWPRLGPDPLDGAVLEGLQQVEAGRRGGQCARPVLAHCDLAETAAAVVVQGLPPNTGVVVGVVTHTSHYSDIRRDNAQQS